MTPDDIELRMIVEWLVTLAIEGGDELPDAIARLAKLIGVPYQAVECVSCGGWAGTNTAAKLLPICGHCADRAELST